MKRKYPSKYVADWQEIRVVAMYKKGQLIKNIAAATYLSRNLTKKILDAYGIRKPYAPAEGKKRLALIEKGTIIQQCVAGMNERHKRITDLFKPTMAA
jgi:hypothetical protein